MTSLMHHKSVTELFSTCLSLLASAHAAMRIVSKMNEDILLIQLSAGSALMAEALQQVTLPLLSAPVDNALAVSREAEYRALPHPG